MNIEIEEIAKEFCATAALHPVSLSIPSGGLVALLGPSGSGKITLLRILGGLEFPSAGRVLFDGTDATGLTVQERRAGFVFQSCALFRHMTVFDNSAYGLCARPRRTRPAALARALAIEPRMLLLDEPFGALDAKVRKEFRQGLRDIHDTTGLTTVFVTHDQEEAMELADLVVVMSMGRIEQVGKPEDIRTRPRTPFVREFITA